MGGAVRGTIAGVLCLLLMAGCSGGGGSPNRSPGSTPGTANPTGSVRVSLGIYSGRPDPAWTLTDAQAVALDRALAALPRAVGEPPSGGLGYHGFTIIGPAGTLVAYRGAVAAPGEGRRAFLSDPALTIERFLLETGATHLTLAEHAEVTRALATP